MGVEERRGAVWGKARRGAIAALACALLVGGLGPRPMGQEEESQRVIGEIRLPAAQKKGKVSLEEVLTRRRSVRDFSPQTLELAQIGQLMWAAQGITDPARGFRTAPSAGATYPLEIYVVAPDGHFRYVPQTHRLERLSRTDLRSALGVVAGNQSCVRDAAVDVVIAAVLARTSKKYGTRAVRYVHLEAGHAAQNILLQATALGLGGVSVGAFYDPQVKQLLGLPDDHDPLYILALGNPR